MKILILCTGNSCRSQMAHGWFDFILGENVDVYSAGVEAHGINPYMKSVMKEVGIDVSDYTSNLMDEYQDIIFEYVITLCDNAKDNCPYFKKSINHLHYSFKDPGKTRGNHDDNIKVYRNIRDQIRDFCFSFSKKELGVIV